MSRWMKCFWGVRAPHNGHLLVPSGCFNFFFDVYIIFLLDIFRHSIRIIMSLWKFFGWFMGGKKRNSFNNAFKSQFFGRKSNIDIRFDRFDWFVCKQNWMGLLKSLICFDWYTCFCANFQTVRSVIWIIYCVLFLWHMLIFVNKTIIAFT